ncbi:kelch repeat-containing protein [Streptomyces sp. NPDC006012]|uniref:Kelch repeat-containing protein n=1 Tax=Streptomyces sp. NPDC006012 TaxID=3364739 RepID=UPI00368A61AB
MVSAAAPKAHIVLVETDDAGSLNLAAGVDRAVALGAKYVSNSWGSNYQFVPEDPAETTLDAHFDHPGVAVVASSGDWGYGVSYPAASPYVTSVGGTSLVRDAGTARGWSESVWNGGPGNGAPGSGCSLYEPKPAFQTDSGCAGRTVADVSAVADPVTGPAVYDSAAGGWIVIGGTSAAAPIITGAYAAAGTPVAGTQPNAYPYLAEASALNDVTSGNDGTCAGVAAYLCTAGTGYDGPTGLGTPNGLDAFRLGAHGEVSGTVTDGSGKPVPGAVVRSGPYTATTDARGAYTLTARTGTYDFTIDAYGYAEATASASVTDGGHVQLDVSMRQLAVEQVSGTVKDGAGHGWPLYARIMVEGMPGGPVWTDPRTGAYTLRLPEKHTYTLRVTSAAPGYRPVTRDVVVGSGSRRADFALPGDTWAGDIPGYTLDVRTASTEPFDATGSAPQGWTVAADGSGTTGGWVFDDPGRRGNQTGGTGGFAIADSTGTRTAQDTQLVSSVHDLSKDASPELSFDTDYRGSSTQTGDVDVSTDGGKTWTNLWHQTFQWVLGPAHIELPLTAYAGEPDVRVRFHYTGTGSFWALDDVSVADRVLTPVPGGLITGTVEDANTHRGVVGATVTDAGRTVRAVTTATPDDPALGDGLYTAFVPGSGNRHFSAAMPAYTRSAAPVRIAADRTVRQDYVLKAGRLVVGTGSISSTVQSGHKVTQRLTVKNTGGATATWTAGERTGTAPGSTGSGTPADAWQPIADLPASMYDNTVDTVGGTVYSALGSGSGNARLNSLYAYDPQSDSWQQRAFAPQAVSAPVHGAIDGKIYYAGGWGSSRPVATTQVYDPATDTWSQGAAEPTPYGGAASAVLDGRLYSVGGCAGACGSTDVQVYDPTTDAWSKAAPYPEPISWGSCGAIGGRLYCAGGETGSTPVRDAFVYSPSSNSWSRIADLPIVLAQSASTAADGKLLLSGGLTATSGGNFTATAHGYAYDPQQDTWSKLPDSPTATTRGGGSSGMYRAGGTTHLPDLVATAQVLRGYDQIESDVAWLSESPRRVPLRPGQSATVTVTLDATGLDRPGTYTATLLQENDTPYTSAPLPVSLKVNGPATS